jgi:hypothetical protein
MLSQHFGAPKRLRTVTTGLVMNPPSQKAHTKQTVRPEVPGSGVEPDAYVKSSSANEPPLAAPAMTSSEIPEEKLN